MAKSDTPPGRYGFDYLIRSTFGGMSPNLTGVLVENELEACCGVSELGASMQVTEARERRSGRRISTMGQLCQLTS
jgi:hypothetical protein